MGGGREKGVFSVGLEGECARDIGVWEGVALLRSRRGWEGSLSLPPPLPRRVRVCDDRGRKKNGSDEQLLFFIPVFPSHCSHLAPRPSRPGH